jgi:hypothetical protein
MSKQHDLGVVGEKIVANELGGKIEFAVDKYDNKKDMTVNGKTIEVKTQVPFITENAFSIRPGQLRKCRSVDELYFVAVPASKSYKWEGWMFKVDPKTFTVRDTITRDGRTMLLIDIEQPAVNKVRRVTDSYIQSLIKFSTSKY